MLKIIGIMFLGIFCGFLMRKYKLNYLSTIITVLIWGLLFLLGNEVGGNPQIINGLGNIGLEALIITIGATLGSVVFAYFLWSFIYKRSKR